MVIKEFISRKVYFNKSQWKKKQVKKEQDKLNLENPGLHWKFGHDKENWFLYYDQTLTDVSQSKQESSSIVGSGKLPEKQLPVNNQRVRRAHRAC